MFLRRCHRKKNGKRHTYWALVESIRTARGSRQRVVAYLGELGAGQANGWVQLGRRLEGKSRPDPTLFDIAVVDEPTEEEKIFVRLKDVALERTRDFGDIWLARQNRMDGHGNPKRLFWPTPRNPNWQNPRAINRNRHNKNNNLHQPHRKLRNSQRDRLD